MWSLGNKLRTSVSAQGHEPLCPCLDLINGIIETLQELDSGLQYHKLLENAQPLLLNTCISTELLTLGQCHGP